MPYQVNGNSPPDRDQLLSAQKMPELLVACDPEIPQSSGDQTYPNLLTTHERLRELTAILATGIHRLRTVTPALPEDHPIPGEFSQTGLETVAATRPYGTGRQPERTPEA